MASSGAAVVEIATPAVSVRAGKPHKQYTLVIPIDLQNDRILLGYKLRGFGQGKCMFHITPRAPLLSFPFQYILNLCQLPWLNLNLFLFDLNPKTVAREEENNDVDLIS